MFRRVSGACMLAAVLIGIAAAPADAIPAFARKYQFSCSTCHAPVPKLRPFGEAFAARGFRLEDPSQEPPRATIDTGDPTLQLMRDLPLAMRLEGHVGWGNQGALQTDFQSPWVFKILSGGAISKTVSYYTYFIIEKGGPAGIEDAWLQFNKVFGVPVDLTVGQFQVCDPMFKRELRLSRFDYQIFKTHVGDVAVDLTYDRGVIAATDLPGGLETVVQVVNGNGIEMADDLDNFDKDNYKNVAVRVAKEVGLVRLGGLYYFGMEAGANGSRNRTEYWGPDLVVTFNDRTQLNAEYLERRDDNPWFGATMPGSDVKTRGGFAEIVYLPQGAEGKWSIAGLYNKVTSDDENARYESVSAAVGRLLARNIRLTFELGREFEREGTRFSIGIVTAF